MIEIKCTQEEKEILNLFILNNGNWSLNDCPYKVNDDECIDRMVEDDYGCTKCFAEHIKWVTTDKKSR